MIVPWSDGPPWLRTWKGRFITDVPLPGEDQELLARMISYAQARDEFMTPAELEVRDCTYVQLRWGMRCHHMECRGCPFRGSLTHCS